MRIFILSLFSLLSVQIFGQGFQITGLQPQNSSIVDYYCDSTISMSFAAINPQTASTGAEIDHVIQGSNFTGFQFAIAVDWGDGTTSNHNGGTSSVGTVITVSPAVSHHYLTPGTYSIVTTIYNPQNQTTATNTVAVTIGGCSIQLYGIASLDCDGDGNYEGSINTAIPIWVTNDFTGVSVSGFLSNNGQLATLYGVPSGNTTVTIDPNWLAQNGYVVTGGYNQFWSNGYGAYTITFTLACSGSPCWTSIVQSAGPNGMYIYSATTSNISIYSWVVTPYNANGAPIGSGIYSTQANAYLTSTFGASYVVACLNAEFANGCTYSVCDTFQVSSGYLCQGGYLFCDSNSNGTYESGELVLSNVPLTISNADNGGIISTTTNTNGYYFVELMGVSGDSIVISINPNYLANMGYTSTSPFYVTLGYDCQSQPTAPLFNIPLQCGNANPFPYLCYSGFVFCDMNGNGIMNPGEMPLASAPIHLGWTNNQTAITVYSDSSGYFSYCGSIYGVTSVALAQVDQNWLSNNNYTLPGNNFYTISGSWSGITQPLNIAVNCGGSVTLCSDLWTTITPWSGYYQNQTAIIRLNWGNYGPGATDYVLTMTWPSDVSLVTSSIQNSNYVISGNTITWTISSNQTWFTTTDYLYFTIPSGLVNGAQHIFSSTITATETEDCYTNNNSGGLLQILGNSYDPNDKSVYKETFHETYGNQYASEIIDVWQDDALQYTIRFQNTGTAPAQNIYILDTLDAELDWSTFELLQTTHDMQIVHLGNGVLRFEFNNIWLPDSSVSQELSQGHLIFRIRENAGNPVYSEITNTAYIYFDWNEAIITNTTYNINDWLELVGNESKESISIYPNPTQDQVNIEFQGYFTYTITDLIGNQVAQSSAMNKASLDLRVLTSGTYFIQIKNDAGIYSGKIIKE
ncbi:MAG: T9SS type A sorting domain-containing protein [Bacteroidota bacterium]